MGHVCVPGIANLFMEQLELDFVDKAETNPFYGQIVLWKWYIDDILVLFKGAAYLVDFMKWLNSIHSSIKFVGTRDAKCINCLDTCIHRDM